MAVVGTKVETMREGDVSIAVKTDVIVDTKTGLVSERKTVLAAVPTEDGKTAVIAAQRTSVAAFQPRSSASSLRAIEAPWTSSTASNTARVHTVSSSGGDEFGMHVVCCIASLLFPPCICCWLLYCCSTCEE